MAMAALFLFFKYERACVTRVIGCGAVAGDHDHAVDPAGRAKLFEDVLIHEACEPLTLIGRENAAQSLLGVVQGFDGQQSEDHFNIAVSATRASARFRAMLVMMVSVTAT